MHIADWMEKVDLTKEIQEVYLHTFLFKLGVKLVGIFIPFYILDLGFSIQTVFMFFLFYYGVYIFISWINAIIASKLGYKHTMLLASPFILGFYLLLRSVETVSDLLILAAIGGTAYNLYWMGMNPEMGKSSRDDSREEDTGFFFSMPSLASIFAPIAGGMILAIANFDILFFSSAGLIGASFLPFLFSREHYSGMDINLREYLRDYRLTDFLTFYSKGFKSMGNKMLWPAYLAAVIGGSLNVGGAGSFMALGSAVTSIFIGKITTEENRSKVIITGMTMAALTYLAMSFIISPIPAFLASLINGLSYTAASVPIYSQAIKHAEEEDMVEYFAVREVALSLGRVTTVIATIVIFAFFGESVRFLLAFSVVAISVILAGIFGSRM